MEPRKPDGWQIEAAIEHAKKVEHETNRLLTGKPDRLHSLSVVVAMRPAIDCLKPHLTALGYSGEAESIERQFCALNSPGTKYLQLNASDVGGSAIPGAGHVDEADLWKEICGRVLLLQRTVQAVLKSLPARLGGRAAEIAVERKTETPPDGKAQVTEASDSSMPPIVNTQLCQVRYAGKCYDVSQDQADLFSALVAADGERIAAGKVVSRPRRAYNALPEPLKAIVDPSEGSNKGYRLVLPR